jgi:hypothetical protein
MTYCSSSPQAPKSNNLTFLSRTRVLIAAGHGGQALLTRNQGLSQRWARFEAHELKPPPSPPPALHSHSTAISRGQIDVLRPRAAQVAAPSAPLSRPTRSTPAYVRHGTRAIRAWRCWGLTQAAYKWLNAVGLGAGACCVHCVVLAPSATPLPNPPPKHSRPPRQCTWTPSLLVARAFRAPSEL